MLYKLFALLFTHHAPSHHQETIYEDLEAANKVIVDAFEMANRWPDPGASTGELAAHYHQCHAEVNVACDAYAHVVWGQVNALLTRAVAKASILGIQDPMQLVSMPGYTLHNDMEQFILALRMARMWANKGVRNPGILPGDGIRYTALAKVELEKAAMFADSAIALGTELLDGDSTSR